VIYVYALSYIPRLFFIHVKSIWDISNSVCVRKLPLNVNTLKLEFSGKLEPGDSNEEITIYRKSNYLNPERGRCWYEGDWDLPQIRISDATYYNWKAKYGGMSVSDLKQLKEMEAELSQLKRMYADLALENRAMKDLIEKKL